MKIIENNFFDLAELKNIIEKQDFFNDCKEPEKKKIILLTLQANMTQQKIIYTGSQKAFLIIQFKMTFMPIKTNSYKKQ